jgi:hypothetical protein
MLDEDIREELEVACMDALRGDPPGPTVAARLQRAVIEVLRGRGIEATVEAKSDRKGTSVTILLPRADRTVQQVVLNLR